MTPDNLEFTPTNWNTPQTVTVTGIDDDVDDGPQDYSVVLSAIISNDPDYSDLTFSPVSATNSDDDSAGIGVSSISGDTTESGGTATFTVELESQPTANVTIGVSSSDTSEGTVSLATLTFTSSNWDTPKTVTVTGVDDELLDGNVSYTVNLAAATSGDPNYSGRDPNDVTVTNLDDDSAGIIVSPTSGLTTSENGSTATFTMRLTSQPTHNVRGRSQ